MIADWAWLAMNTRDGPRESYDLKILGGRTEFDCPSRLAAGGASVIGGAVARRDGRQVLRFGRVKQPSVVDAEGCEAVPMGVRSRQVYRV